MSNSSLSGSSTSGSDNSGGQTMPVNRAKWWDSISMESIEWCKDDPDFLSYLARHVPSLGKIVVEVNKDDPGFAEFVITTVPEVIAMQQQQQPRAPTWKELVDAKKRDPEFIRYMKGLGFSVDMTDGKQDPGAWKGLVDAKKNDPEFIRYVKGLVPDVDMTDGRDGGSVQLIPDPKHNAMNATIHRTPMGQNRDLAFLGTQLQKAVATGVSADNPARDVILGTINECITQPILDQETTETELERLMTTLRKRAVEVDSSISAVKGSLEGLANQVYEKMFCLVEKTMVYRGLVFKREMAIEKERNQALEKSYKQEQLDIKINANKAIKSNKRKHESERDTILGSLLKRHNKKKEAPAHIEEIDSTNEKGEH